MKKKILAVMLCFMFLFSIFPMNSIVNANQTETATYKVTASKDAYNPGDEITFTVKLKQTGSLSSVAFDIVIPEGLTYIKGSTTKDGKQVLGWDSFEITESDESADGSFHVGTIDMTSNKAFTGEEEFTVVTFKCTVNEANTIGKNLIVTLENLEAPDQNGDETKNPTVVPATVKIEQKPVPATGIELNKNTLTLVAGTEETLTATLTPAYTTDNITWSSDKEAVATVDTTGKVTAVAEGTAKITATINGKTAECTVTVSCAHTNKTAHQAVPSTCIAQGNIAYKTCDACGAFFDSSDNKITEAETKLPLADHTYGNKVPEVATTHTNKTSTAGTKAHYKCSVCNKLFLEVNGSKVETTQEGLVIPAPDHTYGTDWKTDGSNHWKECTVCGLEKDKTGHIAGTPSIETITEATCETDGSHKEITKCTICDYKMNEETKTDTATGHTAGSPVRENVVPATCLVEGSYNEVIYCTKCNTKISSTPKTIEKLPHEGAEWNRDENKHWKNCQTIGCGVIIDEAPHTAGEPVKENVVPATCESEGSYEEVKYCSVCQKELSRETKTEPAKGHTEGNKSEENVKFATCEEKGSYDEVTYCKYCNKKIKTEKKEIPAIGHTAGEPVKENIVSATAKTEGSYDEVVYCINCDKELSRTKKAMPKFVYEMLEGMNGEYKYEGKEGLTFKSNGDIDKFLGIEVDGKEVEYKNYTAVAGSTIITLKTEYLDTLSEGKHTLGLAYEDGSLETEFTISKKEIDNDNPEKTEKNNEEKDNTNSETKIESTNKENPETGDSSNIVLWVSGLAISGICFIVVLRWNVKKELIKESKK